MATGTEIETLERKFIEFIGESQTTTSLEKNLRETLRKESARAEAAEAARDAAERAALEARNDASATAAGATQAASALVKAQDQLTGLKIQLDISTRQKAILEEKCVTMSAQINLLEEEVNKLRPLRLTHSNLQRQYTALHERISTATQAVGRETSCLSAELRRVEKCAAGGSEIRERARLAAAAHARERRLTAAELQHIIRELQSANVELVRLNALVAELQHRLKEYEYGKAAETKDNSDTDTIAELQSALEAERAGAAKLEQALVSALASNAELSAHLHSADNPSTSKVCATPPSSIASTNICQIDSFLAE